MPLDLRRGAPAALALLLLAGCVMVPRTVARYDPECRIVRREMVLQPVQLATIAGCRNSDCAALVGIAAATGAASLVVSGSIAVVGNVVYWLERQGQCPGEAGPAAPPPPAIPG